MIIPRLKITNFGGHTELELDANAPVVGLLGPIGSGKSTILEAVRFALTGETADPLDTYVRQGADTATVEMDFHKSGRTGSILRQIGKKSRRELKWEGRTLKSAKEVDEVMAQLLSADKKAVSSAVFIRQGELMGILFGTEAERETLFIKLVNLAYCEGRAKLVDKKVAQLLANVTDLTQAMTQLQEMVRNAYHALETRKAELAAKPDYTATIQYLDRVIELERQHEELEVEKNRVKVELDRTDGLIQLFCQEHQISNPSATALDTQVVVLERTWTSWHHKALEIAKYAPLIRDYKRLRRQQDEFTHELAQLKASLHDLPDLAVLQEHLNQRYHFQRLHQDAERLRSHLKEEQDKQTQLEQQLHTLGPGPYRPQELQEEQEHINQERSAIAVREAQYEFRRKALQNPDPALLHCPTCGTQAQAMDLDRNVVERLRVEVGDKLRKWNNWQAAWDKKSQAYNTWVQKHSLLEMAFAGQQRQTHTVATELTTAQEQLHNQPAPEVLQTEIDRLEHDRETVRKLQQEVSNRALLLENNTRLLADYHYQNVKPVLEREAEFTDEAHVQARTAADALHKRFMETLTLRNQLSQLFYRQKGNLETIEKLDAQLVQNFEAGEELAVTGESGPASELLNTCHHQYTLALEEARVRQRTHDQVQGAVDQAQSQFDDFSAQLLELERRSARDRRVMDAVAHMRKVKELLSRGENGLPSQYVQYRFADLARLTQRHLLAMDTNFQVMMSPEERLAFTFIRHETGAQLPMSKLSGGQRVQLCLAFLMAVQEALVPEVGLLVLDEPSVHLGNAVESLTELLIESTARLRNAESQIWVADHDTRLEPAFGRVLRLS